jgi:hypothetical protein
MGSIGLVVQAIARGYIAFCSNGTPSISWRLLPDGTIGQTFS